MEVVVNDTNIFIDPNSCTSAVTLHKWVSNIHFNIFIYNFIDSCFGHSLNLR